jgi:hypothetical protein
MLKVNYPDLAEKIDNEPLFEQDEIEKKLVVDGDPMFQHKPAKNARKTEKTAA